MKVKLELFGIGLKQYFNITKIFVLMKFEIEANQNG